MNITKRDGLHIVIWSQVLFLAEHIFEHSVLATLSEFVTEQSEHVGEFLLHHGEGLIHAILGKGG